METLRAKDVITRKKHKCHCCLRMFEKGSKMNVQTNVDNGGIYEFRSCETCHTLINEFPNVFYDECMDGYPYGCVDYEIQEYRNTETPESLLQTLRNAKQLLKSMSK